MNGSPRRIEFTLKGLKVSQRLRRKKAELRHPIAPVVQTIVLAYQIERAVQVGRARDYADVARQVGMTRARVCQIMRLLDLPALILDKLILSGCDGVRTTERELRVLFSKPDADSQLKLLEHFIP